MHWWIPRIAHGFAVILAAWPLVAAERAPSAFWTDAWRGWHFYEDPEIDIDPSPRPKGRPEIPSIPLPDRPTRPPELIELERLRQEVEDLRGIAVMRPTEANVRRYMELEAKVVAQASAFADIARRVSWTAPELDPALQGRPVNAKAIEVFEAERSNERTRSIAALARDHVLIFFFRSDCPYCHAFAPTLAAFHARHGLRVEPVSIDGGPLPGFAGVRRDNGIANALRVTEVPAVYLVQPSTGRITPIGFGVLSEAELIERIAAVSAPDFEAKLPSAVQHLPRH